MAVELARVCAPRFDAATLYGAADAAFAGIRATLCAAIKNFDA